VATALSLRYRNLQAFVVGRETLRCDKDAAAGEAQTGKQERTLYMHRYFVLLALLFAVPGSGCSTPTADSAPAAAAPAVSPAATPPAATTHDGRAIEITATDTMKFSVTEITAKPGERLSVTLVNLGTTPKFSMGHNWVLLAGGIDATQFVIVAAEAVTTEYVPTAAGRDRILAATRLLGPKEQDTVTFAAPAVPGRYEFLCSFPGHYQVGMRGVLIVQ
jgi:azurin